MWCCLHIVSNLLCDSVRAQDCAEAGHKNVTAVSVLEALLAGRAVILQDSGFWRQQWPNHEIWTRFPALSTPEAREYQYEVMQLHNTAILDLEYIPRNSYDQVHSKAIEAVQLRRTAVERCLACVDAAYAGGQSASTAVV